MNARDLGMMGQRDVTAGTAPFPSARMRLFLAVYGVLWWLGLPLVLFYIWRRARADALYRAHPGERFGRYGALPRPAGGSVWIHAVSLGELRSAVPLIRALIGRGEHVVLTTFTPAGRREGLRALPDEIAAGQISLIWSPLEYGFAFRRFFRHFRPKYGLVMEIEFWPRMIVASRKAAVPLFLCNGQYPEKSYQRDRGRLRSQLVRGFAGVMVKSEMQAARFAELGQNNTAVTGELRFEQPVPPAQIAAARAARPALAGAARVVTIASGVEKEEDLFVSTIARIRAGAAPPVFVYVPRAPERVDAVAARLAAAGLRVIRRSAVFDADLARAADLGCDVLLGDSFGEMYFYLELADRVLVGGGFAPPRGAHNVIEPMALGKPVVVGPSIWTIEYIARDAIAAGAIRVVAEGDELATALTAPPGAEELARIAAFFARNAGALERTLEAIPRLLASAPLR